MHLNKLKWKHLLKPISLYQASIKSRDFAVCAKDNIKDKVAIVTGGADGIGLECAKLLFKHGVKGLVIGDIHREKECLHELGKIGDTCKVCFKKCDVTNKCQFAELFKVAKEKFCGVDILLNNAGILNDSEWEKQIQINVVACVRGTYWGLDCMSKDKGGKGGAIVNFSSILGMQHFAGSPVYVGTKHFLIGFDRSIGDCYHYKRTCVKIFTICPGVTLTHMIHNAGKRAHIEFDAGMGKLLSGGLAALPPQGPDAVAKGLIIMLNNAESGSVWVAEGNEFYQVRIPDRRNFRVFDECPC